jgi:DNA-binding NarL/FixJ family response regulator
MVTGAPAPTLTATLTNIARAAGDVVVETGSLAELAGRTDAHTDVVLIALSDGRSVDGALIDRLLEGRRRIAVVMVSCRPRPEELFEALRHGAKGYLSSDVEPGELLAALRRITRGGVAVDPSLAGSILGGLAGAATGRPRLPDQLAPREGEVLDALLAGSTNREIARSLHLGEETIKTHVRSIYRKLGVRNRTEAVALLLGGIGPREECPPGRKSPTDGVVG